MAEEPANVVPAEAPQAPESVTPNNNSNTEPVKAPESITPFFDKMSDDDRKSIDNFLANNGGIAGFNKWKQSISNPAPKQPAPEAPQAPAQPQAPVAPVEEKPAEGFLTAKDIAYLQYRGMLASDAKYAQLGDYINSGKFIEEMEAMGMKSVDAAGNLNDKTIRMFLDLKAQTMPAPAPSTPSSTTTPLVEYVNVGEEIKSHDQAMAVLGQTGHPKHEEAMKFLRGEIFGDKKPVEKK